MKNGSWNKFTDEKITEICKSKNLTYINKYYDKERNKTIVSFICNVHQNKGIQEKVLYDIYSQKKACPYCNHSKLKETLKEEIMEINPDIELLSNYVNWDTKIKCKCKIDGNEWESSVSSLLRGCRCKVCNKRRGNKKRKTLDQFKKELNLINPDIEIIDDSYTGTHNLIKCKCKIDNNEWSSYPCNLLNLTARCPECSKKYMSESQVFTNNEFLEKLQENNPNVVPLEIYKSSNTKMNFLCKIHNVEFFQKSFDAMYNIHCGCPLCRESQSYGETKMLSILANMGYSIISQYSNNDCRNILPLRFDGFDIDNNIAFEYNGQQHYYPVDFAGKGEAWAIEQFELTKTRDEIKYKYCKENNIPIIIIPYQEFENMENYIKNELAKIA